MKTPKNLIQFNFNKESFDLMQKLIKQSIPKSISEPKSILQQSNPKKVTDILTKLNLQQTKLNQNIVKNLIKYQLPLNPKLIMNIKQMLSGNEENLTKIIKSIMLLKNSNLNTNKTSIKFLTEFLIKNPEITTDLKKLINQKTKAKDIINKLKKFILSPGNDEKKFTAQKVKTKILSLGLDLEKKLLTQKLNPKSNLKSFLFSLKNNNPQLNEIIDSLIHNLTSQKLIMHQNEKSGTFFLYLQLPLQISQQKLTTGHLTIYRRNKNSNSKEKDENLKLILNLETEKLGLINIELNFQNKNLNININTNNNNTLKIIKSKIETLKTKINNLDYNIQNINYSTLTKSNEDDILNLNLESDILKTNPLPVEDLLHTIDFTI